MLFRIQPLAFVASAIWVSVLSIAFLLVVDVVSIIHAPVWPFVNTLPVHFIFSPISFVDSAIAPIVFAEPSYFVVLPVSRKLTAIAPNIETVPVLLPIFVLAFVLGSVSPDFLAFSFLNIVEPLTRVFTPVDVSVLSKPIRLIILEFSDVNIALSVPEGALAASPVVLPQPFINGPVAPFLDAVSLSNLEADLVIALHLGYLHHLPFIHAAIRCKLVTINKNQVRVTLQLMHQILICLFKCIFLGNNSKSRPQITILCELLFPSIQWFY